MASVCCHPYPSPSVYADLTPDPFPAREGEGERDPVAASPTLPLSHSPTPPVLVPDPVPVASSLFPVPSSLEPCILCSLVTSAVTRGIKALFEEFVNDPESRLRIRSARGFCREHTRLVASTGDALGISILYADLADQTTQRWSRGAAGVAHGVGLVRRSRAGPCPGCDLEAEAHKRYSGALAAGLNLDLAWDRLEESACLCVSHVESVAAAATRDHAERLLALESEKLNKLRAELNEIIRKNDYRFRNEEWGAERDAWLRAINRLTKP
jgi:hypothetical protein